MASGCFDLFPEFQISFGHIPCIIRNEKEKVHCRVLNDFLKNDRASHHASSSKPLSYHLKFLLND